MTKQPARIAVLIPCYNEAAAIGTTVRDFKAALPDAVIYVYDNNSKDDTIARAKEAGAIVRIDGWMIAPKDGSRLTAETLARVAAFKGDLYVVFNPFEAARNKDALKTYGFAIVAPKCRDIVTNLGGPYAFCPLMKVPAP